MAFDLTTAVASGLAGRILASILVSLARCLNSNSRPVGLIAPTHHPGCRNTRHHRTRSGDARTSGSAKAVDDQRGACQRARIIAPQPCIRSAHRDQTMMQSCASAAKLRAAGPFSKTVSTPGPVSGDRHLGSSAETDDILFVGVRGLVLSAFSFHAARKTTPAGASPVVTMRHKAISSFLARATIRVLRVPPRASAVRARYHSASALSF
jgi:hypothetical protein